MDSLKKIIHPHKTSHHSDASGTHDTTTNQHGNVLTGSATGDNIANPFTEPNTTAAEHFRRSNNAAAEPNVTDTTHPHAAPTQGTHLDHHGAPGAPTTAGGVSGGGDEGVPGVATGGAKVVEARMPVEEGNNFPGTNPHPAHNALGTEGGGGLKYPGGE